MKHLYMLVPVISAFVVLLFPPRSGYELGGLVGVLAYLTWNIFAYLNNSKMFPPMNYKIDFSANGDKTARTYLVGLCLVLVVLVVAIWVSQHTV